MDHMNSSTQYKILQAIATRTFKEYTDVKGPFESTKDLDPDYFKNCARALRKESRLLATHLKLAIEEEDKKLYASLIGQVQPVSRGSTSGSDPAEVVARMMGYDNSKSLTGLCFRRTTRYERISKNPSRACYKRSKLVAIRSKR